MKNIYMFLWAAAALLPACSDDPAAPVPAGVPVSLALSSDAPQVAVGEDGLSGRATFRSSGGEAFVGVETDARAFEADAGDVRWLTVEKRFDGFTLRVAPNDGGEQREARLTVTAGEGELAATAALDVVQNYLGGTYVIVEPSEITLTAGGKYPQRAEVKSDNDRWKPETMSPWLLAERDGDALVLTADPNPDTVPRRTTVDVAIYPPSGERRAETVYVEQEARSYVAFDKGAFSFDNEGGAAAAAVTTNQADWTMTVPGESWLAVVREGGAVSITVQPNEGREGRSARIGITAGAADNVASEFITVSQLGYDPDLLILTLTLPEDGLTAALPLSGAVDCLVDWGDGTVDRATAAMPVHVYAAAGTYNVTVDGTATALHSGQMTADQRSYVSGVRQWGRTGLTSMEYALYDCANLASVPGDEAGSFAETTTFANAFQYCAALTEIPADLFAHASKAVTFANCFYNTSSSGIAVSEIPENLLAACSAAEDITYMFYGLAAVTEIPARLLDGCPKLENLSFAFGYVSAESIPEDLLRGCPDAWSFCATFGNMKKLRSIPGELFSYVPKAADFRSTFNGCEALEAIPADLFAYTPGADDFYNCFSNCKALTEIPAGLFDRSPKAENFRSIFSSCTSLAKIPAGLFAECTAATSFQRAFYNCTSLTDLPADLFDAPKATGSGTTGIFYGCTGLTAIPEGLFDSFAAATGMSETFRGCTGLKSVPGTLFDKCPNLTSVANAFNGCASLEALPAGFLDGCRRITNFTNAFNGCTSLGGESPFGAAGDARVHFYERAGHTDAYAKPASFSGCFKGCTGLTDYDNIPSSWK